MRKLYFVLLVLFLVSCGSYRTEVWFNADGSGKSNLHFDVGEMMKQMKAAFEGVAQEMNKDSSMMGNAVFSDSLLGGVVDTTVMDVEQFDYMGTDSVYDGTFYDTTSMIDAYYDSSYQSYTTDTGFYSGGQDWAGDTSFVMVEKKQSSMEKFMSSLPRDKVDTVINFYQVLPDSVIRQLEKPALLKQVTLEVHMDSINEKGVIDFTYSYKNLKEAEEVADMLARAEFIETGDTASIANFKRTFEGVNNLRFYPKSKTIESKETDAFASGMLQKDLMGNLSTSDEEGMNMILDMLGMKTVEVIYHLPGEVKEVKGLMYEQISKDTIKLIFDVKDMIKTGKVPGYVVTYK
ncbi:MAG: hypothetical protein IPN29_21540 [Saprospiraceae bacterium]|nr:hypothetical protein [Saprospiraceae bacterium]